MLDLGEQVLVFFMGIIGAFVWVILSYFVIPNFRMQIRILGESGLIVTWCLLGGLFAWLIELVSSYGLHPAMLCGVFTGFGWSGLFMGVAGMFFNRRDRSDTNGLLRDMGA